MLEQPLTCPEAAGPSGHTLPHTIHTQLGVVLSTCRHRYQRKCVPSVTWRCEDSRRFVVTVTNVTKDVVEDNFVTSVELNITHNSSTESDIC